MAEHTIPTQLPINILRRLQDHAKDVVCNCMPTDLPPMLQLYIITMLPVNIKNCILIDKAMMSLAINQLNGAGIVAELREKQLFVDVATKINEHMNLFFTHTICNVSE
jgi:hypothetical protein